MKKLTAPDAERLGKALRRRREEMRMSREELGRRLNLSVSRLQQYERGSHKVYGKRVLDTPPAPVLAMLASVLETTPDMLIAEAGVEGIIPALAAPPSEMVLTNAAIMADAERAERGAVRITAARDAWERFVERLPQDAKGELLTLLASGEIQTRRAD